MFGLALDADGLAPSSPPWPRRKVQPPLPIQSHQAVVVAISHRSVAIVDEVVGVWPGKSRRTTTAPSSMGLIVQVNLRKTCLSSAPSVHEVSSLLQLMGNTVSNSNSLQDKV
jgi:hypothetical protein